MRDATDWPATYRVALLRLGRLALERIELSELFRRTTAIVAETIEVDFCEILELLPDGQNLLLRAAVGWPEALVGTATVAASSDTHAGRTLLTGASMIVEDLQAEDRFPSPSILHDHGVTSGVSLVIPGAEPFGVFAVHTRKRRDFSVLELEFLETVVDVLGLAISSHRAHETISRSEESFRRTFEDSPLGMNMIGLDGRFLRANRVACEILGYSEEELCTLTFEQVTHPDDLTAVRHEFERLCRGEVPRIQSEKRALAKNGESVWVRVTVTPVRNYQGASLHFVGMIQDLTEQRRRDRDLQLAHVTLDNAQEGVGWCNSDGRITEVNASLCRMLGYSRQELLSMSVPHLHPDMAPGDWPDLWRQLRGSGVQIREFRLRRKDGVDVPVEGSANYLNHEGIEYACMVARDIRERRRAARELEASEARYRLLFENAAAMVLTIDLDGKLTSVNKALEIFSGYSREELVGAHLELILSPDQQVLARSMLDRKLRQGGITTYELVFLTKAGEPRPVQMTSNLIEENGRFVGTQAIAIDITEQRRVREALRHNEEHFRALIENALDVVTVLDADGTLRYASPAIERALGYRPEERIEKNVFELVHPEDAPGLRLLIDHHQGTAYATASVVARLRHKDGSWRYMEANARNLLDDPAVRGIVVNSRDITERKLSEEWFRTSFYDAAIGTGITSLDGRWLQANPALCQLLGYSEKELLQLRWQDVTYPDDISAIEDLCHRYLRMAEGPVQIEKRFVHKAGSPVWTHTNASLTRDPEGKPRAVTVQVVDITQRKKAEEALQQLQDELRALAGRLISNEEDERRSLARELHDDFSQRLTAFGFELAAIEAACPKNGLTPVRERLQTAQASIANLSDDLRRLAHQLHPSAIELLGLPAALRELCHDASRHGRCSVRLSARRCPASVPANVALCLYRVAQECLRNIAKHAGGDKVSVTLSSSRQGLRLSVKDNGVGFDLSTASRKGGLGLISIRERVGLAGGTMTIKSRPGRGTHISVEIRTAAPDRPSRVRRRQARAVGRT
jgi:PAS domain S-box-containing protein